MVAKHLHNIMYSFKVLQVDAFQPTPVLIWRHR